MKYQEFNKPVIIKKGQLRVWHIPQIPMKPFYVYVKDIKEAKIIIDTLSFYDLFQFEHKIKPDYSNSNGLCVYDGDEWLDWEDDEGNSILDTNIIDNGK